MKLLLWVLTSPLFKENLTRLAEGKVIVRRTIGKYYWEIIL